MGSIDAPLPCPNCGKPHNFRDTFKCILSQTTDEANAEAIIERVGMRLDGATHNEAMAAHPPLPERSERPPASPGTDKESSDGE